MLSLYRTILTDRAIEEWDVDLEFSSALKMCDTGVSPEAVKAELKKTFSEKDAARLALSFKTVKRLSKK